MTTSNIFIFLYRISLVILFHFLFNMYKCFLITLQIVDYFNYVEKK